MFSYFKQSAHNLVLPLSENVFKKLSPVCTVSKTVDRLRVKLSPSL